MIEIEDAQVKDDRTGPITCPVALRPRSKIKIVLGPQERFFLEETLDLLVTRPFTLTDAYDRMGVRLSGPPLHPAAVLDMPSQAIVRGSIRVAGDGVATVLLPDHQTTGGYPKIATVVSDQLDGLTQMRSRSAITFTNVSPAAAIESVRTKALLWSQFLAGLRANPATLSQRLMAANLIDGVVSGEDPI